MTRYRFLNCSVPSCCLWVALVCLGGSPGDAADITEQMTLILEDQFDRQESSPEKEEVGNGWTTNSRSRAQGVKQVDLDGQAMHITRADVADHGVSVVHPISFRNGVIEVRFQLQAADELGINIADLGEKSVHAGHLCQARVRLNRVEITDLKTARMNLAVRQRRTDKQATEADKKLTERCSKYFPVKLEADRWHVMRVVIADDTLSVNIDGNPIGSLSSEGIAHPTKKLLRLAVNKSATVDDVRVWRDQ